MPNAPMHFTVVDPRTADGDPYDVAERAVAQLEGLAFILQQQFEPAFILARNAALERQLYDGQNPDPEAWYATAEGKRWIALKRAIDDDLRELARLKRAASYNPREADTQ